MKKIILNFFKLLLKYNIKILLSLSFIYDLLSNYNFKLNNINITLLNFLIILKLNSNFFGVKNINYSYIYY